MDKYCIEYQPKGELVRKVFYFEGESNIVESRFFDFLKDHLSSFVHDVILFKYVLVQDYNPNVPMYMYREIIRGEHDGR